jgi:cytidylate kinase
MTVIAMTREMATLGKDVAASVAQRLGLEVVHHELVEHDIADRAGMRESEVHRFLEGKASLLERWKIDAKRLSRSSAEEVLALAARGKVVIRGWGPTYLLRFVPHILCVRICAPMSFREKVLMERLRITDAAAAQREIARNDAAHNATMQKMFGVNWMDATLYDITLNTSRVPVDDCVEQIVRLTESTAFQETAQSRGDLLILSRVHGILADRFNTGIGTLGGLAATVAAGKVTLTGAASNEQMIGEAVRAAQAVEGVTGVDESQVTLTSTYGSYGDGL